MKNKKFDESIELFLFLDVDGVLNSQYWYERRGHEDHESMDDHRKSEIDPRAVARLNHIVKETGCKVVLSSSWRKNITTADMTEILVSRGFEYELFAKTPVLYYAKNVFGITDSVPRGCEIDAWLRLNDFRPKSRIAILDDDSDMLLKHRDSYFRCDNYCGLTDNVAYRVINYLNNVNY